MVDRRRKHPVDEMKIRAVARLLHSVSGAWRTGLGPTGRPLRFRLLKKYEAGDHIPRDIPGGVIDQMDQVVPGIAALFRNLVWAILKGLPPEVSVLRARLGLNTFDPVQPSAAASTFADLEALLTWVELARAEGRHDAFARAVTAVERAMPQVRFIVEVAQEADAFSAFLADRLLVWRADVEERRVQGLLSSPAHPQAGTDPASRKDGGHIVAQPGSQWKHALAGLVFLTISALTRDQFSCVAAMTMCAAFTACAYSAATSRSQGLVAT
ncbi:MAG: hypothetical protein PGN16_12515 [Sphingomonas phyllosphaerae]|uniref:hypothetical protein n=1 Tax=Sphingomonas phyllosphaerae TaxID=257003 RepID=UPI002FFA0BB4